MRYTPGGLIDTSFANQGILDLPFGCIRRYRGHRLPVQRSDHPGLLAQSHGDGGVTRLNPNGTLDTTFGSNGYFSDPIETADVEIAVQPNDEILLETSTINSRE